MGEKRIKDEKEGRSARGKKREREKGNNSSKGVWFWGRNSKVFGSFFSFLTTSFLGSELPCVLASSVSSRKMCIALALGNF